MIILPKLNYAFEALEPAIDKQTVEIHYTKHHQAYADKLNNLIKGTEWEQKSLEEIIKNLNKFPQEIQVGVRNSSGGVWNHNLYWQTMSPKAKSVNGEIKSAIESSWGSIDKFKEFFTDAALARFGSGWVWLTTNKGKLSIISTPNQDNPLMESKIAILALDVWEHAYYLKYQNRRADYIKAWWDVVDWEAVEIGFKQAV